MRLQRTRCLGEREGGTAEPSPMSNDAVGKLGPETNGRVETPSGPVVWTRGAPGALNAEGGGQQLTIAEVDDSDVSWQSNVAFSKVGAAAYLTIQASTRNSQRSTTTTLTAGQSRLTLAITQINAAVTSGTGTVSGTLNGRAVNWTGTVDLTSNPLTGNAVPGWPQGAFAAEFQQAAVFSPLVRELATPAPKPVAFPPAGSIGDEPSHAPAVKSPADVGGSLGNAGAWCIGGAVAGSKGAGWVGALWGCAGGATGSILYDLWNWYNAPAPFNPAPLPTVPIVDPPPDYPPPEVDPPVPLPDPTPPPAPPPDDPTPPPDPVDSTGTGSGAGAVPGSIDQPSGGDGGGEGIDDKPGHQPS